jgi:hypothetical protein
MIAKPMSQFLPLIPVLTCWPNVDMQLQLDKELASIKLGDAASRRSAWTVMESCTGSLPISFVQTRTCTCIQLET